MVGWVPGWSELFEEEINLFLLKIEPAALT
jgi:hypothetical protein